MTCSGINSQVVLKSGLESLLTVPGQTQGVLWEVPDEHEQHAHGLQRS